MNNFNSLEISILRAVAQEVDEFHVETRKNIPQTKYVFTVHEGATWGDPKNDYQETPVPLNLIGSWMMYRSENLQYETLDDCIRLYKWVKCYKEEIKTYQWSPIT